LPADGFYVIDETGYDRYNTKGDRIYRVNTDTFGFFNCEQAPKDEISRNISEIVLGQSLQTEIKLSDSFSSSYVGTYSLTTEPKRTIVVSKINNHLVARILDRKHLKYYSKHQHNFN
jgi:hypothetical protein